MGIPGFNRWIVSNFPEIVRVQSVKTVQMYDHVAFDMNQILHLSARKASDRTSLAVTVFRELDRIFKNCIPNKSIFFAFDGPAPLAKLVTQRKNRSRNRAPSYTARSSTQVSQKHAPNALKAFDRVQLTPGVDILYFIKDAIQYWAYTRLQSHGKYEHISVRISGSDVPGEGELKLIDFCRSTTILESESVVIVGCDADIILQGLATVPVRNFFVYLPRVDRSGRHPKSYVLSVWELARSLEKLFPNESSSSRLDFILISILNGNGKSSAISFINSVLSFFFYWAQLTPNSVLLFSIVYLVLRLYS